MNSLQHQRANQSSTLLDWEAAFIEGSGKVGGKAWNLGRLHRYGFNVPDGGVLPVHVYEQFMSDNSLFRLAAMVTEMVTLDNISAQSSDEIIDHIQKAIHNAIISPAILQNIIAFLLGNKLLTQPLAVRSSATAEDSDKASFAGIHDSCLNVTGPDALQSAIKTCYASIWSKRAIAYRRKMGIADNDVLPAVIIMQLIDADAAGVAFSCDPASGREDVCMINANFGLGESVVQGSVEPDTYIIHRHSLATEVARRGEKQSITRCVETGGTQNRPDSNSYRWVLSAGQQSQLGNLVARIYSALSASDTHQDIEWALKDNVFYILQARPVTVLPRYTEAVLSDQPDIWSNSNFRDALPMVVPVLQRDVNISMVNHTILASFQQTGLSLKPGLSIAKLIQGRLYFNTGLYQRLIYNAVGMMPEDFGLFSGGHQPNINVPDRSPYSGAEGFSRIMRILGYARLIAREQKNQHTHYKSIESFIQTLKKTPLDTLSDKEFLNIIKGTEQCLFDFMDKYMLLCAGIGPFGMAIKALKPLFGDEAIGIVSALSTGQGNQPSANQVYGLLSLAEIAREDPAARTFFQAGIFTNSTVDALPAASPFKRAFKQYIETYGYRAVFEADISQPRWNEDPGYLLGNIALSIDTANVAAHKQAQQAVYLKATTELKQKAGFIKRLWVTRLIKDAVKGADTRETAKSWSVRLFGVSRMNALEAARRLFNRGLINRHEDIFYCSHADVSSILSGDWDGSGLKYLILDRNKQIEKLSSMMAPDVVIDDKPVYQQAVPLADKNAYQGIGVSSGQVEGIARLIHNPAQGLDLKPGEIMVAPSTDPSWTPLFINAAGIILETGGYTSHGSIVAREYGIPAVVNIAGALGLIKDGQRVVVDGSNGHVVLLQ